MPTATLPQISDFQAELRPVVYLPPSNNPSNVIVFLPGLGDTAANFSGFAKALNLPDAVTVTLEPPFPLPFPIGPGQQWSDDILFDQATGKLDPDSPLTKSAKLVAGVLQDVLIAKLNFTPLQIHLFGFGQGGSVALSALLEPDLMVTTLGSVVSIGGPLAISANDSSSITKKKTPILLLGGSKGALIRDQESLVKRVKTNFEFVEYHAWKKNEDSMPTSREEVLPMMQFLAQRLRSLRGVPQTAVEVGG